MKPHTIQLGSFTPRGGKYAGQSVTAHVVVHPDQIGEYVERAARNKDRMARLCYGTFVIEIFPEPLK